MRKQSYRFLSIIEERHEQRLISTNKKYKYAKSFAKSPNPYSPVKMKGFVETEDKMPTSLGLREKNNVIGGRQGTRSLTARPKTQSMGIKERAKNLLCGYGINVG